MGRVSQVVLEIRALEPGQASRVLEDRRFWTSVAFDAFLARTEQLLFEEPSKGLALAEHAPRLAERTRPSTPNHLARAMATLGHSYRACGELSTSAAVFQSIDLSECSDSTTAYYYTRLALLLSDQGSFDLALRAANDALSLLRPGSVDHTTALVIRGIVRNDFGIDLPKAADDFRNALKVCNAQRLPRIHYASVHNLGVALLLGTVSAEDLRQVFVTLKMARRLLRRYQIRRRSIPDAKLRWVEALALIRIGSTGPKTERLLAGARADLLGLGAILEAARVSLDLGELYREQGRWEDLRRISADVVHLDRSEYSLDTLAALLLWRQGCLEETLDDTAVDHVYKALYGIQRRR